MTRDWSRWCCYGVGAVFLVIGVLGLARNRSGSERWGWGRWVIGGALIHDLLIAPMVAAVSLLVIRVVPARIRPYVTAALVMSALVTVVALLFVLGLGRRASNVSALPLNYPLGYVVIVALIWLGVGVVAVCTTAARRRHERKSSVIVQDGQNPAECNTVTDMNDAAFPVSTRPPRRRFASQAD